MDKNIKCDINSVISTVYVTSNCMRCNTRQFRWIKILCAILNFVISTVHVTSNCMRRNTRQFRCIKILSAILHFVINIVCYIELYEAQHPPVQMDKNTKCDLTFCDQYYLCYIELYEAQHPPVQINKNIKCDLNSVISTVYVTSNCMRRNTRQFR